MSAGEVGVMPGIRLATPSDVVGIFHVRTSVKENALPRDVGGGDIRLEKRRG